jgi:hypothetical protein
MHRLKVLEEKKGDKEKYVEKKRSSMICPFKQQKEGTSHIQTANIYILTFLILREELFSMMECMMMMYYDA